MIGFCDIWSTLADLLPDNGMSMSERGAYALRMLVVGMAMVFAVLAILWIVLSISKIFLHDMPEKRKAGKRTATPEAFELPVAEESNDEVLVAVITAAIAAAMEAEGTQTAGDGARTQGFRVVSFRRTEGGAWNRH